MEEEKIVKEDKDLHIKLLKESLWDVRDQRNFFKLMNVLLCGIITVTIICCSLLIAHSINGLKDVALQATNQNVTCNTDK